MESVAIFEAKFDPPTLAHVEIIKALRRHVDRVVVYVRRDAGGASFEHRYEMAELVCGEEGVDMVGREDCRSPLQLFLDHELADSDKKVYWAIGVDSLPDMEARNPIFFNEVKFLVIPSQGYRITDAHKYRGNLEVSQDKITPMQSGMARRMLATYKKHASDLASFERFVDEYGYLDPRVTYYIATNKIKYELN